MKINIEFEITKKEYITAIIYSLIKQDININKNNVLEMLKIDLKMNGLNNSLIYSKYKLASFYEKDYEKYEKITDNLFYNEEWED